jgi:ligand-binding SRPBCC domain-containing protein
MRLHLQTAVQQDFKTVFEGFNEKLFLKLAPPFPKVKLIRFDGSKPGDMVAIEIRASVKTFIWTSLIIEENVAARAAYFIDEGQVLPPPLKKWRHKHLVTAEDNGAIIHDIIEYSTGSKILDVLLYPIMWAQFSYRKPVYKKVFAK